MDSPSNYNPAPPTYWTVVVSHTTLRGPTSTHLGQGTKLIRVLLTGEDWMDPSTLRIMLRLNNLALPDAAQCNVGPQLRPLGGPWSFSRGMRIPAASQLVEDVDQHDRIHEMMRILIAKERVEKTMQLKLVGNSTSRREATTSPPIRESLFSTVCTCSSNP